MCEIQVKGPFNRYVTNAMGGGGGERGLYGSADISVTKVYSPTLLALCGGWGVKFPDKKY